jgi:hypothetical protein
MGLERKRLGESASDRMAVEGHGSGASGKHCEDDRTVGSAAGPIGAARPSGVTA